MRTIPTSATQVAEGTKLMGIEEGVVLSAEGTEDRTPETVHAGEGGAESPTHLERFEEAMKPLRELEKEIQGSMLKSSTESELARWRKAADQFDWEWLQQRLNSRADELGVRTSSRILDTISYHAGIVAEELQEHRERLVRHAKNRDERVTWWRYSRKERNDPFSELERMLVDALRELAFVTDAWNRRMESEAATHRDLEQRKYNEKIERQRAKEERRAVREARKAQAGK